MSLGLIWFCFGFEWKFKAIHSTLLYSLLTILIGVCLASCGQLYSIEWLQRISIVTEKNK